MSLFKIDTPEVSADNMGFRAGKRMYLSDGRTTVLLSTEDSKLARNVRKHLIKLYVNNKGPGKDGWKDGHAAQVNWISSQTWTVKGLIIFMNDEPIYTVKEGSERITSAFFQDNVAAIHRIRTVASLDKAEASLTKLAKSYKPGTVSDWFAAQVTDAQAAVDSRRASIAS